MSTKKLGFGMMRLPVLDSHDDSKIDLEQAKKMVDIFIERGFTYFDTAYMYHSGKSETVIKEVLVKRYPRDAYFLVDKFPIWMNKDKDEVFKDQLAKGKTLDDLLIISLNKG